MSACICVHAQRVRRNRAGHAMHVGGRRCVCVGGWVSEWVCVGGHVYARGCVRACAGYLALTRMPDMFAASAPKHTRTLTH
jgi:hypothetical protein